MGISNVHTWMKQHFYRTYLHIAEYVINVALVDGVVSEHGKTDHQHVLARRDVLRAVSLQRSG